MISESFARELGLVGEVDGIVRKDSLDSMEMARNEGAIAFVQGVKVGDNPYSEHDNRHWTWIQGWATAGLNKNI